MAGTNPPEGARHDPEGSDDDYGPDRYDSAGVAPDRSGRDADSDAGAPSFADDPDLVAAKRTVILFAVALLAVGVGAVAFLLGTRGDDGPPTLDTTTTIRSDATVAIGPVRNASVASHLSARATALEAASGPTVAVVSLTGYVDDEALAELLGPDVTIGDRLVALVGGEPSVSGDLDATRQAVLADAEAQLAEIESIAPTVVDDPDFSQFYAAEIVRYRALIDAAERTDIVFGVVVTADADVLRALAMRDQVRLVDVAAGDASADDVVPRGLRPEETVVVGDPATRP